jgi:hypothetical protein
MLGLGLQFNESTVLERETKLISQEKKFYYLYVIQEVR